MDISDSELLAKFVRDRDEAAFREVLVRHSRMVLNVCNNLLLRKEDAEDAFQIVFAVLARKAPKLLGHNAIGGWLHVTATRTCLQMRRQIVRKREMGMLEHPASTEEPWQSIAEASDLEILHREISQLPKKYREVIVRYHLEGQSRDQIAAVMDCTTTSVKALLSRARAKLRNRLLRQGIAISSIFAVAATVPSPSAATAAVVSESLIQSTMAGCLNGSPIAQLGSHAEIVESLMKESAMMLGRNAIAAALCGVLICGVTATTFTNISLAQDTAEATPLDAAVELESDTAENELQIDKEEKQWQPAQDWRGTQVPAVTAGRDDLQFSVLTLSDGDIMERQEFPGNPVAEEVPYTVTVPVKKKDGTVEMRKETRVRTINKTKQADVLGPCILWNVTEQSIFSTVAGKRLDHVTIKKRLATDDALFVVRLLPGQRIHKAWRSILKPDAIVMLSKRRPAAAMRESLPADGGTAGPSN